MPITLIQQKPDFQKKIAGQRKLSISEMFCDTLQGEGVHVGNISTFVRLQGCTLRCVWCDTLDVWPHGNEYSFDEIFEMWNECGMISKFQNGQHLILTGGSPLKQQMQLENFLSEFKNKYGFLPFIEVENEAVLSPNRFLIENVSCWNNSPKLANSGMKEQARLRPSILKQMSSLNNSWFKFVVSSSEDWKEIERDFLPHIKRDQIIVMPEGQSQQELNVTREIAANIAIREGVRYSDRMHITIWNQKTGV